MKAHLYFLVCTFLFLPFFVNAQLSFLENKGQWDQQVLFRSDNGNNSLFLGKDGYTMLMQDANDYRILSEYYHGHSSETAGDIQNRTTPPIVKLHAYKVKFLHANINSHLIKENALMGYENFFIGNDASKWATGCKSYQAITYKNIYKGIDLVYYVQNNHLKYDLVIYPGADISQIQ